MKNKTKSKIGIGIATAILTVAIIIDVITKTPFVLFVSTLVIISQFVILFLRFMKK